MLIEVKQVVAVSEMEVYKEAQELFLRRLSS